LRNARLVGFLSALILLAKLCCAQQIMLPQAAGPASVDGPWLISVGDPPDADAAANATTGQAALLSAPPQFSSDPQVLWFRATLRLSSPIDRPALLISPRALGCQIFINAVKTADCAQLSAANDMVQRSILIHLPAPAPGAPIAVAIRLVHPSPTRTGLHPVGASSLILPSQWDSAGLGLGPNDVLFGSASALADHRAALDDGRFLDLLPQALLCVAELLGGAILILLFIHDRRSREYAWFAAFLWLDGCCSLLSVFKREYPLLSPFGHSAGDAIGLVARYAVLIGFLAAFTGVRINRWVRGYQVALFVIPLILMLELKGIELGWWHRWLALSSVLLFTELPFVIGSLVFLAVQWRRGNKEAGLLLSSFLLANGIEILMLTVPAFQGRFHWGRFGFDPDDLSMFFFLFSIAPIMVLRQRRITLEHTRATAELDAAREIQQHLVPAVLPMVEGFALEAAYRPAAEVGGDFYLAMKRGDGGLLLMVGDVSGKGLKAAMRGALALGLLRAYAAENLGPGALLEHTNREMQRTGEEGFITCICATIGADGRVQVANAGHLSPYWNGVEIEFEGAFPLGVFSESSYPEHTFALQPGDKLTFLSDGIVEAQNASGELFGFERTHAISTQPALAIADAAQQFGQNDDITVLTLSVAPAPLAPYPTKA
jgi:phosphoserine phosphatase RsbU/P